MKPRIYTERLKKFGSRKRKWQGIPSIERIENGTIFVAFYSGGKDEQLGNYCVLLKGDEKNGFSEPVSAVYAGRFSRCFDPCLWIDGKGRLWFFWSSMPRVRTWAAICEKPMEKVLRWSKPFIVGDGVMLNKPLNSSHGLLFPLAVWKKEINEKTVKVCRKMKISKNAIPDGAYAVKLKDGKFIRLGKVRSAKPSYDEHIFSERRDGALEVYIRTAGNIEKAESDDGGVTWSNPYDSGIKNPNSRFFIGKLKSGRILLVNHYCYKGRNNLTALLSEDDGKTFPYSLLLDERNKVSYPDAVEGSDGYIYIVYDRERGSLNQHETNSAKEILLAKVTESDILAGKITDGESRLKFIVSKIG